MDHLWGAVYGPLIKGGSKEPTIGLGLTTLVLDHFVFIQAYLENLGNFILLMLGGRSL